MIKTAQYITIAYFLLIVSSLHGNLKVAAVLAHPDDEAAFPVTLYKIARELNGDVDVILITDGQSGYKYSTLAEPIYHLDLTNEEVGKKYLPFIRKQEALDGGKILGARNYYFFEEIDTGYTLDPSKVLNGEWDVASIKARLKKLIERNKYDMIFVTLPLEDTHGHHKAAAIIALEVVNSLTDTKPTVLAGFSSANDKELPAYKALKDYPITNADSKPIASIDRLKKFGYNDALNYQIIANWFLAAHKSQGTLQLRDNKFEQENIYFFDINDEKKKKDVQQLFERLNSLKPNT